MAGKKKKIKRKINSGLKAWNDARSYIAKENRLLGKKYNAIELNSLTKGFLLENYGKSWNDKDLEEFLKVEVKDFYGNPLKVDLGSLSATQYYRIDGQISTYMPKGITVIVNAGGYGKVEFNTASYDYHASGLQGVVENIRKDYGDLTSSEQPMFDGFIKQKPNTPKDSPEPTDYFIKWILFANGEYSTEIRGTIAPIPSDELSPIFKIKVAKKGKKQAIKPKKVITPVAKPTPAKKTAKKQPKVVKTPPKKITKTPEVPRYSAKEIISIEKAKQKTMENVLQLLKAGYTKEEINKLLNIN